VVAGCCSTRSNDIAAYSWHGPCELIVVHVEVPQDRKPKILRERAVEGIVTEIPVVHVIHTNSVWKGRRELIIVQNEVLCRGK
jgi:hypothetical protein